MSPNEFDNPEERDEVPHDHANLREELNANVAELPREQPPELELEPQEKPEHRLSDEEAQPSAFATRAKIASAGGMDRKKLAILGAGLLAAVLFFVFTAVAGRSPARKRSIALPHSTAGESNKPKGSVTPLMDAVATPDSDSATRQITANDIERTRSPEENRPSPVINFSRSTQSAGNSLGSVPSFSDTQQRWEEPKPYNAASESGSGGAQRASRIKESSLVFVANAEPAHQTPTIVAQSEENSVLELTPGTRILAKVKMLASTITSGQIVAEVQYTYALGDQIVIPAGTLVYGHIEQADQAGYATVKFNELEVLHRRREKIDAIGTNLNLGPIKGIVYGKNTGRNFLVRAASGLGEVGAMLVGNNTGTAFSENDLLRQRIAENIGEAGDAEVMNLALTNRTFVVIPAETLIYVVFTRHDQIPTTLHRVSTGN